MVNKTLSEPYWGLPEFRIIECRKSGKPDLRCQARQ